MANTPAPDAVTFYETHGWYVADAILPLDLVDRAAEAVDHLTPEGRDGRIPQQMQEFLHWEPGQRRPQRLNQYIVLQYRAVAEVVLHPAVGELAARLSRSAQIRLFNSSLVRKEPGTETPYARVGWHCDQAYWPTCTSNRMLTAWIPLQDTTVEMGTLTVLDGSHAWRAEGDIATLRRQRTFIWNDHDELQRRLESAPGGYRPTPLQLKRGQVSFHHALTYHGSGINTTRQVRKALSVHLQNGENRYRPAFNEDGELESYVHDTLVRRLADGTPDYADPEVCPVIWPR